MPDPAIAVNRLQPLQVRLKLPAQIAFDQHPRVPDRLHDRVDLLSAQFLRPNVRCDVRNLQDTLGCRRAQPVDVLQANRNSLVVRDVDTKKSGHIIVESKKQILSL